MSLHQHKTAVRVANIPAASLPSMVLYDRMVVAIAEAKSVDEVKGIRDTAEAMRAAARVAKNKNAEADLAEIRFRGERRLGELMAEQRDAGMMKPGNPEGWNATNGLQENPLERPITLAEVGIDKSLADRARKYAAIRDAEAADPGITRRALDGLIERGEEPTKAAVRREIAARPEPRVNDSSLWLWGRLRDFDTVKRAARFLDQWSNNPKVAAVTLTVTPA